MFEDAFRELRRQPGGGWKSSGERTASVGPSTCKTTYTLTLYGCGENMPERGHVYQATLASRIHSAPSPGSSVVASLPSGARVRYTQTRAVNGKIWLFVEPPGRPQGWAPADDFSCGRPIRPPVPPRTIPPEDAIHFEGTAALASAGRG
jgi:hypothetical protein